MKLAICTLTILLTAAFAVAQPAGAANPPTGGQTPPLTNGLTPEQQAEQERLRQINEQIDLTTTEGIAVRIADIGGFRGAASNKVIGYGLVVGLDGTGDSRSTPFTAKLMANALSRWGTIVDAEQFKAKNIATVSVTCELPPFAAPGRKANITVSSIGDAKSLQGGYLLPTPLTPLNTPDDVYVLAGGPVSIGGFSASSAGSSASKNHQNVGRIPDGGDIQRSVNTQFVFEGGIIYFDLDEPDFVTASRVAQAINESYTDFQAMAMDGVTIQISIPSTVPPVYALSQIEATMVKANLPASVVINERTGTIVIGGSVKLGPAVIAHGSLQVRIQTEFQVSQPPPFSKEGQTVVVPNSQVNAGEDTAQVTLVGGSATISDLAKVLQTLRISATDIIAIMQALAAQGALKARIKIQ